MIFYMENETNNEINETSEDLENSAEMFPKGVCEVGSVVDGVVSGIAKFGAFVDLPDGRRGLVHISQISEGFVKEVRDCLEVGQKVKVYIVSDVMKNNIDNNYIKYQINGSDVKTLNMDGMIIVDTMQSNSKKNINLKLWISDTYEGDLSYSGRVVVV